MSWFQYWQDVFAVPFKDGDRLDQLVNEGYLVLDSALPHQLYAALVAESQDDRGFQAAKISVGGRAEAIRSDTTRWIERDTQQNPAGKDYLNALEGLGQFLNQSLYLGVRSVEAHYACYQVGQFYAQHRDNPQGTDVRAMSTVLYLNGAVQEDWRACWGGSLRLTDSHDVMRDFLPSANRLVVFHSDLQHEVLAATQVRRSIAGWLRRDMSI